MRKEPQRRYQSAEQLGEDIRRHLAGLPVIARPDTLGYRSAKFVRRHRLGVGAAAVIAIVLVGGIASTAYALQGEQRQRIRADNKFQQVRELARVFMFDFHDAVQELNGSIKARQLLVTTALDYLDGLALEAGDDDGLKRDLASGYDRVGDIRGGFRNPSLGDTGGALQSYRQGLDLREALLAERPDDLELCKELTTSYMHVGVIRASRSVTGIAVSQSTSASIWCSHNSRSALEAVMLKSASWAPLSAAIASGPISAISASARV